VLLLFPGAEAGVEFVTLLSTLVSAPVTGAVPTGGHGGCLGGMPGTGMILVSAPVTGAVPTGGQGGL
jgi:hypothetical protein